MPALTEGAHLFYTFVHAPTGPRRSPATTVDRVLVQVIRSAMDRDWSAENAAAAVLDMVQGNARLLRRVRVRLLARARSHPSDVCDRALATLAVALRRTGR